MSTPLLLVFSHLRWRFGFQRPQHLLSRLAGRWRVVYVEEPLHDADGPGRLEQHTVGADLTVLVPHTPVPAFHDDPWAPLKPLLTRHLRSAGLQVDVAWLSTPMALPLVEAVRPTCVVYDCMDDLSAFKDAPRLLRQRESALLRQAALVLAGGPSLYETRRERHTNIHCVPSAVDADHFAPSNLPPGNTHAAQAEALQAALPQPRLGYFGIVDERLDFALIAQLADSHPEWTLVMAGPVVDTDPATLPRRPNIHWLGLQPYDRLPHLLAGWDLCLLPFAMNEATRALSPIQTLEYMAGEKPVVSTPVRDVISLYGEAVAVAPAPMPFVRACEALLAADAGARCRRALTMLTAVSVHSWQRSADSVHTLLSATLAAAVRTAAATSGSAAAEGQTAVVAAGGR